MNGGAPGLREGRSLILLIESWPRAAQQALRRAFEPVASADDQSVYGGDKPVRCFVATHQGPESTQVRSAAELPADISSAQLVLYDERDGLS